MELRIEKFAELRNRGLKPPCAIVGMNGAGKTSMLNAYLWCLTGKGKDGYEMGEAVYSQNDKPTERYAAVEVEFPEITFRRVCKPIYQRENATANQQLKSLCATEYYLNGVKMPKNTYERAVNDLCKDMPFQLFSDIGYFSRLAQKEQIAIFMRLLGTKREDFFKNIRDIEEINADMSYNRKTKKDKEMWLEVERQNYEKLPIPTDFSPKIAEIKAEIDDLMRQRPRLSADQIADNNRIIAEIAKLEAQPLNFTISNAKRDNLNEKKVYFQHLYTEWQSAINDRACTEAALRKAKEDMAKWGDECEFSENTPEFNDFRAKIDTFFAKREKDAYLLENYQEYFENASCRLCPHCDNIFCENKVTDLPSEADLVRNITEFDNKRADLRAKMSKMRDDWQKAKEDEHKEIAERISRFEENLAKIDVEVEGAKNAADEAEKALEIAKIEYAKEIDANKKAREDRDRQIAENNLKIAELRAKMHTAEASSTDDKIADLKVKLADLEGKQRKSDEEAGYRKGMAKNIDDCITLLGNLEEKMIELEKERMAWEQADKAFREAVAKKAAEVLPEGLSVTLFRPLVSGNGCESVFELKYDDKKYKNTALKIKGDYDLTAMFQREFGVNLPIFVDDMANITDERYFPKGENLIQIVAIANEPLDVVPPIV